jgi:exopolysaccharide biosynthesis polyprenyl glycosylphosphotransferase
MTDYSTLEEPGRLRPAPRRFFGRRATDRGVTGLIEGRAPFTVMQRDARYRRSLAVADGLASCLMLALVTHDAHLQVPLVALVLCPLGVVLACKLAGLYDRDPLVLRKTTLDEAPSVLQITGICALVVWLLHARLLGGQLDPAHVLAFWLGTTGLLLFGRVVARTWAGHRSPTERCLVIGDPASIRAVQTKFRSTRVNAQVVASVPLHPQTGMATLLAHPEDLAALVAESDVHRVVIAPLDTDAGDTLNLIRVAKAVGVRVSVMPRLLEVVGSAVEYEDLGGLSMLGVRSFGLTRSSCAIKRTFDFIGASAIILATAPLMAAIAAAIKLTSPGPVLFRQTRVGRDGEPFEILKFRSMVADAEALKESLRHLNETQGLFKIADDPRVTGVGRFIRATSLDELPQLFNVWRGEMSLVGPRPLVVDEDAKVSGMDRARLHLTPGMTGHWQILGSARVPMHEMVGIDYLYVANWSLWTDIKILLRTVSFVFSRSGV